jgi:hypothetical protein
MKNTWECEGDCYNGKGTKKWKDGGIEKGTWKNGELTGQGYQFFGKTSDFAGDWYEGEFLNGYYGFGKYYFSDEDVKYVGYWKNGKQEGKGKIIYGQNSEYPNRYFDGEWKNGMKHGYGIKFWGEAGKYTNNRYEGDWKNDEMDGFGRYDWPDKGTYIGQWKDGEQHGEGIFIFLNGDTLKSLWFEGYCKDLAVTETGEDASYFKTSIDEINYIFRKTGQLFIDETYKELSLYQNNSSYSVDFPKLRKLLDSALINQKKILPKLEEIEEYDKKIPYKRDFLEVQYAFLDVMNKCDKWINLTLENGDKELIQKTFDDIFGKLKIMKEKQEIFKKTKKKFKKKYW